MEIHSVGNSVTRIEIGERGDIRGTSGRWRETGVEAEIAEKWQRVAGGRRRRYRGGRLSERERRERTELK